MKIDTANIEDESPKELLERNADKIKLFLRLLELVPEADHSSRRAVVAYLAETSDDAERLFADVSSTMISRRNNYLMQLGFGSLAERLRNEALQNVDEIEKTENTRLRRLFESEEAKWREGASGVGTVPLVLPDKFVPDWLYFVDPTLSTFQHFLARHKLKQYSDEK